MASEDEAGLGDSNLLVKFIILVYLSVEMDNLSTKP